MRGRGNRPGISLQLGRLSNFQIAARRLGMNWHDAALTTAASRFARLWPVWMVGTLLVGLCAVGLDVLSVGWVRGLPAPVIGFFQWVTVFGKSDWLLYPSGALCLVLLLCDWRVINRRVAAAWTEIGLIVGFAFLSIAGSGIVMNIIKQLVGRGRPLVFDRDGAFSSTPFQFDYAHASFPSGHATVMGALAVVVAVLAPHARWPVYAICATVAVSRVFVAAHFPSDVVAGFLLGAAFTWFYATALCHAGNVFERGSEGTIKPRTVAIRRVFLQSGGFSIAMGNLWLAIVGLTLAGRRTTPSHL